MNYTFNICECDAETLQAEQQAGESDVEYRNRISDANGKHFFRVLVQDAEQKQFGLESPYFDKTSEHQKWNMLDQAMKMVKKAMVSRDRSKKDAPAPEVKCALITNGVEQEMRMLKKRSRN